MLAFRHAGEDDGSVRVDVRTGTGLAASATVSLTQARLAEFFAAMARDWRGWAEKRELTALPPGTGYSPPTLRLTVTADGRATSSSAPSLAHRGSAAEMLRTQILTLASGRQRWTERGRRKRRSSWRQVSSMTLAAAAAVLDS